MALDSASKPFAWTADGALSRGDFLAQAQHLAPQFGDYPAILNRCDHRLNFALGWMAAWIAGRPTVLPPDQGQGHRDAVADLHPGLLELQETWMRSRVTGPLEPSSAVPKCDRSPAVIPFTSGSTGTPLAHPKSMAALKASARLIAQQLGSVEGVRMVATVPSQHMYGLEVSLLLPWFERAVLDGRRPFFPLDIVAALAEGPGPVALVTTPFHLQTLLADPHLRLPEVSFLVSATAPLSLALAQEAEQRFRAPLHEIFGCTELGSVAGRRPTQSDLWTWYEGVTFEMRPEGPWLSARHMESAIPASDQMEPVDSGRFRLLGRHADQVNIVGKRVSIRALEHAARCIPGCEDAAFLIDDTGEGRIPRAVAFIVLAKDTAIDHIREGLRSQLDPAFVPRTLIPVACIPRNRTGKVLRADLVALLSSTRKDDRRS